MTQFRKDDTGKAPLDLLPFDALASVAQVLGFGAARYGRNNWRKGGLKSVRRYRAAALRHIAADAMGERVDSESSLPHLAHAVCCLLFIMALRLRATPKKRVVVKNGNITTYITEYSAPNGTPSVAESVPLSPDWTQAKKVKPGVYQVTKEHMRPVFNAIGEVVGLEESGRYYGRRRVRVAQDGTMHRKDSISPTVRPFTPIADTAQPAAPGVTLQEGGGGGGGGGWYDTGEHTTAIINGEAMPAKIQELVGDDGIYCRVCATLGDVEPLPSPFTPIADIVPTVQNNGGLK